MKCVCGYEYVKGVEKENDKGDEKFIDVTLSNDVKVQVYKGMGDYETVYLKACPKCHTIKMTDWIGK